jgi:hypothetical protein
LTAHSPTRFDRKSTEAFAALHRRRNVLAYGDKVVLLQITAIPRSGKQKETFYRLLAENLQKACGIAAEHVIVSYLGNGNDDWSFGGVKPNYSAQATKDARPQLEKFRRASLTVMRTASASRRTANRTASRKLELRMSAWIV